MGRVVQIIVVFLALLATAGAHAQQSSISRGHQLILNHGLQIQAWVFPGWVQQGVTPAFPLDVWEESNLTTAKLIDASGEAHTFFGPPPGIKWGFAGWRMRVTEGDQPYIPNLVSMQYGDEQNLGNPAILAEAVAAIQERRSLYPNALHFTNQVGTQHSLDQMRTYMAAAEPDMLMFDTYPFTGSTVTVPGGSPNLLYSGLAKYRQLGLEGIDGTGRKPIPVGMYTQTFVAPQWNNHRVTESEMRLNQFSAWVYGLKFVTLFIYDQTGPEAEGLQTIFFDGPTSAHPKTAAFYEHAELARQSRNLGPALIRLLSTDVRFKLGRYRRHGPNDTIRTIDQSSDMLTWSPGQTVPYLTNVTATNLGTENYGLEGNVILGGFRVLHESYDGIANKNEPYFMIVNGLSSPVSTGTAANTRQRIELTFDFGVSGITALQRLSRYTGQIEDVPLVHEGGSIYSLDLVLDGGTGDLFKFRTGVPFVTDPTFGGDIISQHDAFVTPGTRIEMRVQSGGGSYTWFRDGVALVDDGRIQGSTTHVLVLDPSDLADTGTYVCHIYNPETMVTMVTSTHDILVVAEEDLGVASPIMIAGLLAILAVIAVTMLRRWHGRI